MPKLTTVVTTPMTPSSAKTNTSTTMDSNLSKSSSPQSSTKTETKTNKKMFVDAVPPLPTVDPALAAARAAAARAYALSSITADSGGNNKHRRRRNNNNNNNRSSPSAKSKKRGHNNTPVVVVPTPPQHQQLQQNPPYATPPHQRFHHHHHHHSSSSPSTMRPPWMPTVPPTNQYMPPPPYNNNHAPVSSSSSGQHHHHHHSTMPPASYRAYHLPPKAKRKLVATTAPVTANKKPNTAKRPRKPKGKSSSSHPRSIHPNLYPSIKSLPILPPKHNIDPDDEEYAKFVKSLISTPPLDKPQPNHHHHSPYSPSSSSLTTNNNDLSHIDDDDDEEEEYQISASDEEDDEENDENDNETDQDEVDYVQKEPLSTDSAAETVKDVDQSNTNANNNNSKSSMQSSSSPISTRSNTMKELSISQSAPQSPHDQNNINNNTNAQQWLVGDNYDFYAELEAELGSLLEEDMEAAVSTLLNGTSLLPGEKHPYQKEDHINISTLDGGTSNGSHTNQINIPNTPSKNKLDEPNTSKANNIHHDQSSNYSHPQNSNSVTFPSDIVPVITSPLSPLKDKRSDIMAIGVESSCQLPKSTSHLPPVMPHQIQELQDLMSQHYQLLLQQSILAVRALHVNKIQKEISVIQKKCTHSVKKESTKSNPVPSQHNKKNNGQGKQQQNSTIKEELSTIKKDNSVRARCNNYFLSGESPDDWAEILDGAVGMLQDLDQNRKDAIRYAILMEESAKRQQSKILPTNASVSPNDVTKTNSGDGTKLGSNSTGSNNEENVNKNIDNRKEETSTRRIMTRSAFSRTLKERDAGVSADLAINNQSSNSGNDMTSNNSISSTLLRNSTNSNSADGQIPVGTTTFDVKGLALLKETFSSIDNSVRASSSIEFGSNETSRKGEINILEPIDHGDSCEILLRHAHADYDIKLVPHQKNLTDYLSYPKEIFGDDFKSPICKSNEINLRKSKFQFTAAEDNLLLMGINLYGEKEWSLISNRFLPDRSVSLISQRYAKLCVMIYKANGIKIDEEGSLETPPEHPNGVEDFDEEKISKLSRVKSPTKFDVHRWSLEEDITLLKAVPLMGHMWAEVANRFISHRDRGHLRKRYQVLERRVKATIRRQKKLMNERNDLKALSNNKNKSEDAKSNILSSYSQPKKKPKAAKKKKQKPISRSYPPVPKYARSVSHGFGAPPPGTPVMMMNPFVSPMMPMNMQNNMSPSVMVPPANRRKSPVERGPPSPKKKQSDLELRIKPPMVLANKSVKQTDQGLLNKDREHEEEELLCSEKIGSLLPETNGSTKQNETPQNSKMSSLKSLTVSQFSMSGSLSGFDARGLEASNAFDSTRMGFEKIINEGDDWSQLSGVKKLIENDKSPHSKVKSSISSVEGSNGPLSSIRTDKDLALLPCLEIYKSSSGLSVLNESRSSIVPTNAKSNKKSGSILSEVLGRVKENSDIKNDSLGSTEKNSVCSVDARSNENNFKKSAQFIPSNKTIGSMPSTPSANMTYGGGMSMDSFEFNNMTFSDRSRSALKDSISLRNSTHTSSMNMHMAFSRPFQSCGGNAYSVNSLMANDYEAITALNSMSNSSVNLSSNKFSKLKNSPKLNQTAKLPKKGKTSLFAKVVGGAKAKDEKKKVVKARST